MTPDPTASPYVEFTTVGTFGLTEAQLLQVQGLGRQFAVGGGRVVRMMQLAWDASERHQESR